MSPTQFKQQQSAVGGGVIVEGGGDGSFDQQQSRPLSTNYAWRLLNNLNSLRSSPHNNLCDVEIVAGSGSGSSGE